MNLLCIALGIAFCIFGCLLFLGKLHNHIRYWNEQTESEKEKVKIVPLCRNIGTAIFLCGIIFAIKGCFNDISNNMFTIIMVIWFIMAGFDLLYIEKSNYYKNR